MNPSHFLKQINMTKPKGQICLINTIDEIADFIIKEHYSVGFYNPATRNELNWKKTNILILDIDEVQPNNKTMKDVTNQLSTYKHIIAPTKSHNIPKGPTGIINDRYRILLFLNRNIYSVKEYKLLVLSFCKKFDLNTDLKAKDPSHFFYSSISIFSKNANGSLLDVDSCLVQDLLVSGEIDLPVYEKSDFKYRESNTLIPKKLADWIFEINSKGIRIKRERFIRILMSQKDFVSYDRDTGEVVGLGRNIIPQVFLADYLKIEVKTLRRWIKCLVDQYQLEYVGNDYGKGWKCKEYKALNDLEKGVLDTYYKNETYLNDKFLPTTINDGEWEKEIIKAAWCFVRNDTPENFYNWANSLPTLHEKRDRMLKVSRAWKSAKKRYALLVYDKIDH